MSQRIPVHAMRLYLLHGECTHAEPYCESEEVLVAWGGVFAQFALLAATAATRCLAEGFAPRVAHAFAPLFFVFVDVNVVVAAINLIPVRPFDGYIAWRAIPLVRARFRFVARASLRKLRSALDFKKRRATVKHSRAATADLLDRMRKK